MSNQSQNNQAPKNQPLILTMEEDTARITLNRPEVHNALSMGQMTGIVINDLEWLR